MLCPQTIQTSIQVQAAPQQLLVEDMEAEVGAAAGEELRSASTVSRVGAGLELPSRSRAPTTFFAPFLEAIRSLECSGTL